MSQWVSDRGRERERECERDRERVKERERIKKTEGNISNIKKDEIGKGRER